MTCIEQFSYFEHFKTLCMVLMLILAWCVAVGYLAAKFLGNAKDTVFLDKAD